MDQWLDSLSEDWVSQPRSPHSSSVLRGSILRDSPSPVSNASQSRIPRYKPLSVSAFSTASDRNSNNPGTSRKNSQIGGALREKTSSNINAIQKAKQKKQSPDPNGAPVMPHGRQTSIGSVSEVAEGTVQHKASPMKLQTSNCTPDWKRRILKENGRGDLFSPIGLESVFKPPTIHAKQQANPTEKRKPSLKKNVPSSPPSQMKPAVDNHKVPGKEPQTHAEDLSAHTKSLVGAYNNQNPLSQANGNSTMRYSRHRASGFDVSGQDHSNLVKSPRSAGPEMSLPPLPRSQDSASASKSRSLASKDFQDSGVSSDKSRNEDFSPFYVSRHNTVDGRIGYAAVDASMHRLRSQMDSLRLQQQNIPSSRSSDNGVDYFGSKRSTSHISTQQLHDVTSQSLPDNLSMGTDAFAASGGFVSIRRGGYSNDGSFQRRPESPSLLPDPDGPSLQLLSSSKDEPASVSELSRKFSQTKSKTPSSAPASSGPRTPQKSHERSSSDDRPRSSGSPLKLFDRYDTFTNDKLIRRMSKFEETLHNEGEDNAGNESSAIPSSPSPRRRRTYKQNNTDSVGDPVARRISSFGDGDLNDHQFRTRHEISKSPEEVRSPQDLSDGLGYGRSVSSGSKDDSRARGYNDRLSHRGEHLLRAQIFGQSLDSSSKPDLNEHQSQNQGERGDTISGKRPSHSPAKDPAPKRRKTLLAAESTHLIPSDYLSTQDVYVHPVSGRKRKDARYADDRQAADPSTLATRQILQPKVPTLSQTRRSSRSYRVIMSSGEPCDGTAQAVENASLAFDPPTQIVAGALATIAVNTAQEVTSGSRKVSVTTADFFNEAQQIMQLIRAKGRPRSSHATTEGSEIGAPTILEESFVEDFTKDNFSRPPSREGSPRLLKEPARVDARAASHLCKFKDDQDLGLALSSSLKTLKISQSERQSLTPKGGCGRKDDANSETGSEPPNIRIRESNVQGNKRKYSSSTHNYSTIDERDGYQNLHPTSGPSSSHSNPTGSSRSSTHRMIIAPETVAHLLSDQMAGMFFDRQKQLWVKRKGSSNMNEADHLDHMASEGTDEDFFGDIPDLSVDEMEELQRVKDAVSSVKSMGSLSGTVSIHDHAKPNETKDPNTVHTDIADHVRPKTADGKSIPIVDNSSAPSKFSHFESSISQPGTRATSWGDDAFPAKQPHGKDGSEPPPKTLEGGYEDDVEHEISILDGRKDPNKEQPRHKKHQARVVTVAFSSPLVEQWEPDDGNDDGQNSGEESEFSRIDSPVRYKPHPGDSVRTPFTSGATRKFGRRSVSRHVSMSNQSHLARPMSRLDEEDEMSMVHYSVGNRHLSMEVAITTPLPLSRSLMIPPSTNGRSSIGFQLSPLPEFTMHQVDRPIDDNRGKAVQGNVDTRLSLAGQELIKKLTDLEPYEPYWDFMRRVDLHGRGLGALYMLDVYCGRVEELDVSENQISELNGIPQSVRQLNVCGNCLSDLAAWDPLENLQYLDVSNNEISTFQGFRNLIHLRSLRADGNEIQSMSGLEDLTGLTSLSARRNKVKVIDFSDFQL